LNKKILIVGGDKQNAKALSFLLAGSGYAISSPSTAGEAVEAVRHQRFDLAITDEAHPENSPNLDLVSHLKQAQPTLPVLYLAAQEKVETVIRCIRAGVTEVISKPNDLRQVIETTHQFLRGEGQETLGSEVTWEDILEVERILEAHARGEDQPSAPSNAAVAELEAKLEESHKERDQAAADLATCIQRLEKSKLLVEELRSLSGGGATDVENAERTASLDNKERQLKEMSQKLSQQKFEVESQLAELEAQQVEFEEAQKDGGFGSSESEGEVREQLAAKDAQQQEMEVRIRDLERELEQASGNREEEEAAAEELQAQIQDLNEQISEKAFIVQQRDREIESLKSESADKASNADMAELEEAKRLIELEKFKLAERRDQFDIEKRIFEESQSKSQKEILVERRDAEISLRELQNTIKEEQLKLKVDQATLKEEMRQFEQARQNFQEDIQDLQQKQTELKKLEAYLQQMEKSIESKGKLAQVSLPRHEEATDTPELGMHQGETPPPAQGTAPSPIPGDNPPKRPEDWSKPDLGKKAGRGPLRIGRRSAF